MLKNLLARLLSRPLRWTAIVVLGIASVTSPAQAFVHVVKKGETLAEIAERYYGRIHYESILVFANALQACGGSPIVAGMRLEIPVVEHHRVQLGETWSELGLRYLGALERGEQLARANDAKSWEQPEDGSDIRIPYNLRYIVAERETIVAISDRFFSDRESAWMLDRYNLVDGKALDRGDVVLIPLTDLPVTEAAKQMMQNGHSASQTVASADSRRKQKEVESDLPKLSAEVRKGQYVHAVMRANQMLAVSDLTKPQLASIHRALTEAYVALGETGLATAACSSWRRSDPLVQIDPVMLSPKIVSACLENKAAP